MLSGAKRPQPLRRHHGLLLAQNKRLVRGGARHRRQSRCHDRRHFQRWRDDRLQIPHVQFGVRRFLYGPVFIINCQYGFTYGGQLFQFRL